MTRIWKFPLISFMAFIFLFSYAVDSMSADTKVSSKAEAEVNKIYAEGAKHLKNKEYDQAIVSFTRVIKLVPHYPASYYSRANAYLNKGEHNKAIRDYSKVIEIDPNFAEAYRNRAASYRTQGRFDNAIDDYSSALAVKEDKNLYYNRAVIYYDKGQSKEAIEDYTNAIRLDPKFLFAYNNRGITYASTGQYDNAIKDFSKVIELDKKNILAFNNRGNAYLDKGMFDEAMEDYLSVQSIAPNYAPVYYNIARIHGISGNSKETCRSLNKSIKKGFRYWEQLKRDSSFDNVRDSSCFMKIVKGK